MRRVSYGVAILERSLDDRRSEDVNVDRPHFESTICRRVEMGRRVDPPFSGPSRSRDHSPRKSLEGWSVLCVQHHISYTLRNLFFEMYARRKEMRWFIDQFWSLSPRELGILKTRSLVEEEVNR